jgi:AcrR family transcriptional regulator
MAARSETLLRRKQQLVRDAIWDAAIGLFAKHGFEEVTVDEVADAAGVSPRSFFRYFSSKSDLLAQAVFSYGQSIGEAIEACPKSWPPLEVMKHVTQDIAEYVASNPRTRVIMRIGESSVAAREALAGSLVTIEDRVAAAFQSRLRKGAANPLKTRLYAALTLSILQVVTKSWATETKETDIAEVTRQAFTILNQLTQNP